METDQFIHDHANIVYIHRMRISKKGKINFTPNLEWISRNLISSLNWFPSILPCFKLVYFAVASYHEMLFTYCNCCQKQIWIGMSDIQIYFQIIFEKMNLDKLINFKMLPISYLINNYVICTIFIINVSHCKARTTSRLVCHFDFTLRILADTSFQIPKYTTAVLQQMKEKQISQMSLITEDWIYLIECWY